MCNKELNHQEQQSALTALLLINAVMFVVEFIAGWIFSKIDVIANIGVITAGVLVSVLVSPLPDLIIGLIISVVVISGGVSILRDVKNESLN